MRITDSHLVILAHIYGADEPVPLDAPKLTARAASVQELLADRQIKREGRAYVLTRKGLKSINGTS